MRANAVFKKAVKTWSDTKASELDRALARHQVCLGVAGGDPYCLKVARKLKIDPIRPLDTVFFPGGLAQLLQNPKTERAVHSNF